MGKILFLNTYDDPAAGGGVEMTLHHLTHGLRRCGIEPVILSTAASTGLDEVNRNGVRVYRAGLRNVYWPDMKKRHSAVARRVWHVGDSYNLSMQTLLRRVLEVECPDVVSLHNLSGWSAAAWRTIADMRFPSVQVLHDSYVVCPKATMYKHGINCASPCMSCRLLRLPHRRLSNLVSAVVGVSDFILNRHVDQGYFRQVPIRRVIHNARDRGELGADVTPAHRLDGPLRFGFIGRLALTKGIEVLLKAFSAASVPEAELWIAGSGKTDYEQPLRQRYASKYVRFLGRVSQQEFYPQVDVVVVPSLWNEPLGMVVAEAMAFGCPVIASRRGGIPEMIEDGINGMLFEPNHPWELVAAMERIAHSSTLRSRMRRAALAASKRFVDIDAWVSSYRDLYASLARCNSTL